MREDLVSRQVALDAFMEILDRPNHAEFLYTDEICRVLNHLPSAQPEIIRCGDCKHKGTKNCVANAWATIFGVTVKDDFYCGIAERRTANE